MSPSVALFRRKRVVARRDGGSVVLVMDVYEVVPEGRKGLFLDRFRLSWIAFDPSDPEVRVLFDSHPPVGLHCHVDGGPKKALKAETLDEALLQFEWKVTQHFGELEERIYEDLHL